MKQLNELNMSESLNSLTLWMKYGFEGMYKADLEILIKQVQDKIDGWELPSSNIDDLYKNLAETVLAEVKKIIEEEGIEGAVAARF